MREKKLSLHTWGGSILALKDTVDFEGQFFLNFFSCQTEHYYFNYSFQERFW